jgi:hypothetical protein
MKFSRSVQRNRLAQTAHVIMAFQIRRLLQTKRLELRRKLPTTMTELIKDRPATANGGGGGGTNARR